MDKFCYSCGIPLNGEDGKDYRAVYCNYCTDEKGELYPKELIQKGIVDWFAKWAPKQDEEVLMKRAEHYLKSMPAWAEDLN